MNARFLLILLAFTVALAFTQRYRKLGLVLSGILVLLILWFNVISTTQAPQVSSASSSAASINVVRTAKLVDPVLAGNGAPWQFTGIIENTSSLTISAISVQLERWDCPTPEASQADCTVLWQGQHIVRLRLAPQARGKFDDSFYSHGSVVRARGVVRDLFVVTVVN